jgi:hypothetical protein
MAFKGLWDRPKTLQVFSFYVAIAMCGIFELPRFYAIAVTGKYHCQACYSMHLLGGAFFFVAYSIVAYQWSGVLVFTTYAHNIFNIRGLLVLNVVFGIMDIISAAMCSEAASLHDYFASNFYLVQTLLEAIKNLLFSLTLFYFGVKLTNKFRNFSDVQKRDAQASLEQKINGMPSDNIGAGLLAGNEMSSIGAPTRPTTATGIASGEAPGAFFGSALIRLSIVLGVLTACFIIRVCMLGLKIAAIKNHQPYTNSTFGLYGFLWFLFTDFIPRALPCIVLSGVIIHAQHVSRKASCDQPRSSMDESGHSSGSDEIPSYQPNYTKESNSNNISKEEGVLDREMEGLA